MSYPRRELTQRSYRVTKFGLVWYEGFDIAKVLKQENESEVIKQRKEQAEFDALEEVDGEAVEEGELTPPLAQFLISNFVILLKTIFYDWSSSSMM